MRALRCAVLMQECKVSATSSAARGTTQGEAHAFETPEALLGAVGLHEATQQSFRADLKVHHAAPE